MPRKCPTNPNKKSMLVSKRESPGSVKRKDSPKCSMTTTKVSIKLTTSSKDKAGKKKTNPQAKSVAIHRKTTPSLDRNKEQQQQQQQHSRRKSSTLLANKSSQQQHQQQQHGDDHNHNPRNNPHHNPQLPERVRQLLRNKGYTVIRYIDRGSTSYVYKVRKGGQFYAAKVMDHSRISKMVRQQFLPNELRIVREIKHMFIVETFDVIEDEGYSILINEYANNGDLISFIESISRPDIPLTRRWIKQIARALAYLHSKGIAHRDVKADNVLLCNGVAKLSDFTYSQYSLGPNGEVMFCNTFCGTIEYKAPETLLCDQPFDPFIADCFSFGVLVYTLVTLEFPFGSGSELRTSTGTMKLYQDIQNKCWKPTEEINNDRKLYSLLRQLLNPDTSERITMNQVLAHSWFG